MKEKYTNKINVNSALVRAINYDSPVKMFYSMMRSYRESGAAEDIIDVGSTSKLDDKHLTRLNKKMLTVAKDSIINQHSNVYPSSWGMVDLRKAFAKFYLDWDEIYIDHIAEMMVTGGTIKAIDSLFQLIDADYLLVPDPAPYFVKSLAILRKKKIIYIPIDFENKRLMLEKLNPIFMSKIKNNAVLYMGLPIAPSGVLLSDKHINNELIPFMKALGIFGISDAHVFGTGYCDKKIRSIFSYVGTKDVFVETLTISKEMGLPGMRVGALVGNTKIINAYRLYASCCMEMIPTMNQYIASKCLSYTFTLNTGKNLSKAKLSQIEKLLKSLNATYIKPDAGIDLLIKVPVYLKKQLPKDVDASLFLSNYILKNYHVGICPGSIVSCSRDDYLVLVLEQPNNNVINALTRLHKSDFSFNDIKVTKKDLRHYYAMCSTCDTTCL